MVQIYGSYQRLEFSGLSLQLELGKNHYNISDGDSRISRIGYDRIPDPDLSADMFLTYGGASHTEGPSHPQPYKFTWNFANLDGNTYATLRAIIRRSHQAKQPVRLYDALLTLDEVAPRTRAKVGAYSETIDGIAWFYPIFDVWLALPADEVRIRERHFLTLEGKEWNPKAPIPIAQDVAL